MSKQLWEQWLKQNRRSFFAGVASVMNVAGSLPPLLSTTFYQDPRQDMRQLSGDWNKVVEDLGVAYERESQKK